MKNLKRERDTDVLSSSESATKKPTNQADANDVIDNGADAALEGSPEVSEVAMDQFISDEAKKFLLDYEEVFNDLINLSSPARFVDYLDENRTSYDYYKKLYDALNAVTVKHSNEKVLRKFRNKKTGEPIQKLDLNKLIEKMNPCQTDEDRELLRILNEGISSWRLLKLVDLYYLSENEDKKPLMDALIWLEKRRGFLKGCLNSDNALMRWLDHEKQKAMKNQLIAFTEELRAFLSTPAEVWNVFPPIMDVRMLWHTFQFHELIDIPNHIKNARILQNHSYSTLIEHELREFFLSVYPSPWACFIDAINGLDKELRSDESLRIDHDILTWQLLTHVSNTALAEKIVSLSSNVDVVAEAFHASQKERLVAPLADSITGILSPIHNSPTKQKEKAQQVNERPTSRRKIENELNTSTPTSTSLV